MKTLTLSLWLACIGMVHAQLNAKTTDCTFGEAAEREIAHQISANLPSGIWSGFNQHGQRVTLEFLDNGLVQWFTQCDGKSASSRLYSWECRPSPYADASLLLTDWKTGAPTTFDVKADCNVLTIISSTSRIELAFEDPASKAEMLRMARLLTGNWENTIFPFDFEPADMEGAYLNYRFNENGRFVRKIGNRQRQIEEHGSWTIAKDAKHLILSFDNGKATVAELKYVRVDELVIHHLLSCQDEVFNTVEKDFYFNRY
jgi:hypothetical protein